jgi:hypothetical protein
MRASTYRVLGTVERHSDAVERLKSSGDCVIVERGGVQRLLIVQCPDGCGEIISVNLDRRSGPAWRLYNRRGLWSLYPSIDKPSGCESHFILSYGKIFWTDADWFFDDSVLDKLDDIKRYLAGRPMTGYAEIADHLDALPWDILLGCRALVRQGLATEGTGRMRWHLNLCRIRSQARRRNSHNRSNQLGQQNCDSRSE